jgi:hypothetical protein
MDLSAIGQQFGLTPQQTAAAVQSLGPAILAGMNRSSGSGGLADILAGLQGGASNLSAAQATLTGNDILGQIFGSKDVSRGVAQQAAGSSGISSDILKKLLPIIAALVMSQLAGRPAGIGSSSGGGLGDILGSVLRGGLGDILGSLLGGGSGASTKSGEDLLRSVEQALGKR